ncbi:hypothetical protein TKK_0004590 [Trichogramma kaykai]
MSLNQNNAYYSRVQKFNNHLKSIRKARTRREEFCRMLMGWSVWHRTHNLMGRVLIQLMNDKSLFPSVKDKHFFLKFSVKFKNLKITKLLKASKLEISEVRFKDGRCALHYLADLYESTERVSNGIFTFKFMKYLLKNPRQNYVDGQGYTYLHGACSTGDIETVKQLICQGVDVNLDTYKFSPLFIAAQSRRENVVEVLLEHGANPNYQNLDQSTPLHALASLRVCDCVASYCFCDRRRPVDKIVNMLINKGANIEARNCHGDTPLQSALLVFDSDLLRTLLEHGANVNNLNEDRMFRMDFTPFELKNYPITLNMIEAMKSLQSAGYSMNLHTALRMMKYWMRVRGNDIDYFTLCFDEESDERDLSILHEYKSLLFIHTKYGLYFKQEALDYLHQQIEKLSLTVAPYDDEEFEPDSSFKKNYKKEITYIKNIMVTEHISLYQLCQMSYSKGYSILKNIKNWRVPPMNEISCQGYIVNRFVKRHIANILIRSQLELLAADFFMSDDYSLNLPYVVCRQIAEYMSDNDLFRLCEQTN